MTKLLSKDIKTYEAQTKFRYNALFSQMFDAVIPLNTTIYAGDVLLCRVPEIGDSERKSFEDGQVSGYYLVKEISHYYDSRGSWTSLSLLRDSYGLGEKTTES